MTSLLDHIRGVNKSKTPEPEPVGPFIWTEEDGTDVEYDYDDKVIMKRGDDRMDDDGKVYFIPLRILPEFDYHDEVIEDNQTFWDWMKDFLERNNLKPTRQQRTRTKVNAQDWGFGQETKKKYLSDWWGGSTYFKDADETKKYAIALQAVKSTVRVIDSHTRRLTVELADTDMQARRDAGQDFSPTSVTDFSNRRIFVSACALADDKLEQGDGIDITTGFALHEASHGEYTEDVFPALEQPTRLKPLGVSGHLLNVMEDVRIEALTSEGFPGFEAYFDKTNAYMWSEFMVNHAPDAWGPSLVDKLNAVTATVKWGNEFEDIARADPILSDEFDWWRGWRERYLDGGKPRTLLVEAMDRLKEDPETQEEMEDQAQQETAEGLDSEELKEALKKALQRLGKDGNMMKPCSSVTSGIPHDHGLDVPITGDDARRAQQLAEEELTEDKVISQQFPHGEGAPGDIVVLRPIEDDVSRDKYNPPNAGLVQKLKSAFLLRPSAMEYTDRLQKGGTIDEDEIWRAGAGDMRFFERKTVESTPDTSIAVLVDCSGSMNGRKLRAAVDAASIIHACTKDMRGVRVRVYGHTGDVGVAGEGNASVFKIWERGDNMSRLGLLLTQQKGDNYDGYALGWVAQDLMKNSTPEEQQILFIISDGLPNGWGVNGWSYGDGYGGEGAMDHVRSVVTWAERLGVDVIQIAIDPSIREAEQARMYKHWVPFEDANSLPNQIMGVLKKLL